MQLIHGGGDDLDGRDHHDERHGCYDERGRRAYEMLQNIVNLSIVSF
jgi:hypothetical protein